MNLAALSTNTIGFSPVMLKGGENISDDSGLSKQAALDIKQSNVDALHISDTAKALNALFGTASASIQQQYVKPFTSYDGGHVPDSAYLNVRKYNDHLFGKAADAMVAGANQMGVTLNKADVMDQLKAANSEISGLDQSQADRNKALGTDSIFTRLTQEDLDNLTNQYIAAKESGLSTDTIGEAASKMVLSSAPTTTATVVQLSDEDNQAFTATMINGNTPGVLVFSMVGGEIVPSGEATALETADKADTSAQSSGNQEISKSVEYNHSSLENNALRAKSLAAIDLMPNGYDRMKAVLDSLEDVARVNSDN